MTKRFFPLFLFLNILQLSSNAAEVPLKLARKAAVSAYQSYILAANYNNKYTSISNEEIISANTIPLIYVFNFGDDEGYVLIAADDRAYPLLAYNPCGSFKLSRKAQRMPCFIDIYKTQVLDIIQNKLSGDAYIAEAWNKLLNGEKNLKSNLNNMIPLINTQWDQGCFYNDSCPADAGMPSYFCGHVPTGCVATAMAQVMRFHKHPQQGTGSNSYTNPPYGTLTAHFGATIYQWNNMPLQISSSSPEIARLMFHCGVAAYMNYAAGSSTSLINARNALITYFNYPATMSIVTKYFYSDPNWEQLLRNELDSARPILYSGYDPNGPDHAFVCDGYQFNSFFHFNWGWSGQYDGYYYLSGLNPGTSNFTASQEAIIGIRANTSLPVAHFTAYPVSVAVGGSVDFTDLSSGNPTNWQWIFNGGNPTTSNQQHPSNIIFNNQGCYDVTLIVSNSNGSDTLTLPAFITVSDDLPAADFMTDTRAVKQGDSIVFTDLSVSISNITSWLWTFAGGIPAVSNLQNPGKIKYAVPGKYAVSLTVTNGNGFDQEVKTDYIIVYNNCDTLFDYTVPYYYINPVDQAAFSIAQEDLDGKTPLYASMGHTSNWMTLAGTGNTNYYRGATSMFTPPGQADNWLEFGPLTIPPEGAVLYWQHSYLETFYNKRDGYEVKINTSGISHLNYTYPPVFTLNDNDPSTAGDTTWKQQFLYIDGNTFGNTQVYIAVHHNANNMSYLLIDNVCLVHYQWLTGIADIETKPEYSIFPNPCKGIININYPEKVAINDPGFSILDSRGASVFPTSVQYSNNTIRIDISSLSQGIYFLKIHNEQSQLINKIVLVN